MADQWEYMFVTGTNLESTLNQLGAQGWEAVGFSPIEVTATDVQKTSNIGVYFSGKWNGSSYGVLLKRRKP